MNDRSEFQGIACGRPAHPPDCYHHVFRWLGWLGVTKQSGTAANREQVLPVTEESNEYCCARNLSRPVFKTAVCRLGEASCFHHPLPGTRVH